MSMTARSTTAVGTHSLFPVPTLELWNRMPARTRHTISLHAEKSLPRSAISSTSLTEAWERETQSAIHPDAGSLKERVVGSTYFER